MVTTKNDMLLRDRHRHPRRVTVCVADESVNTLVEGLGTAFDIGGMADSDSEGCFPALTDTEHWNVLLDGMTELGINWLRLRIPGELISPERGTLDAHAEVLERLGRFHGWAEAHDVNLVLDLHPTPEWLAFPDAIGTVPAPGDLDVYAREYAGPILDHVINTCGYSRIRYFRCFSEPFNEDADDFTFGTPPAVEPYEHYIKMNGIMRAHLDTIGLTRDRLELMGPASPDLYPRTLMKLEEMGLGFASHVGAFDCHVYRYRFDHAPPVHHVPTITLSELATDYLHPHVAYARAQGKPFFLTELGCMYYGKSNFGDRRGPARHETLIAEAELIVRALNAGVDGFLKWGYLFSPRETHGGYQLLNTADGSYTRQPNYYGYASLCPPLRGGADILRVTVDHAPGPPHVHVAATRSPGGLLSMILVNNHASEPFDVTIAFDGCESPERLHVQRTDIWDRNRRLDDVHAVVGSLSTRVPALSITVLSAA